MAKKMAIADGKMLPDSDQLGRQEGHTLELEIPEQQNSRNKNLPLVLRQTNPKALHSHPRNSSLYGSDEDVRDLVELIRQSGWIRPLVVTPTGIIISGHRRWKAVLTLGWEIVPVEVREFPDELAELEALLLENASRIKSTEQKVREAIAWQEIKTFKAKLRQTASLKIGNHAPVQENFPERERGQARDRIASRASLGSGRTYEKAAAVVREIDSRLSDTPETSMAFRKVLNEQSIDAAHRLLKKPELQRQQILSLIANGEAKSTGQAEKMVKQKTHAEFNAPYSVTLAGFSAGDWVKVNDNAQNKTYIGIKGQVEQILVVDQQISVNLEDNFSDASSKVRFYPHELTLIAKATLPCPFQIGDIVFVDIDRHEAVSPQEKKWNGCWGKVTQIGEMGSVTVDVGKESLQLFPRDLKPIDAPNADLREVVERVLRLRGFELDEIEERMLDVLQRREWFASRQLDYLDFMEKLYLQSLYSCKGHS